MENITIIATIKAKDNNNDISNKEFYSKAQVEGNIYLLDEFEKAFNRDSICLKSTFIRVLEVSKSSFRLV